MLTCSLPLFVDVNASRLSLSISCLCSGQGIKIVELARVLYTGNRDTCSRWYIVLCTCYDCVATWQVDGGGFYDYGITE